MTAIRLDLDAAIMGAVNFQGFVKNMRERGYEVEKRGRDWRIKPQNHTNFSRLRRFGEKYTEDAIIERIIRQRWPSRPPKPEEKKTVRRGRTHGDFRLSKVTWNACGHSTISIVENYRRRVGNSQAILRMCCERIFAILKRWISSSTFYSDTR